MSPMFSPFSNSSVPGPSGSYPKISCQSKSVQKLTEQTTFGCRWCCQNNHWITDVTKNMENFWLHREFHHLHQVFAKAHCRKALVSPISQKTCNGFRMSPSFKFRHFPQSAGQEFFRAFPGHSDPPRDRSMSPVCIERPFTFILRQHESPHSRIWKIHDTSNFAYS